MTLKQKRMFAALALAGIMAIATRVEAAPVVGTGDLDKRGDRFVSADFRTAGLRVTVDDI